MEWDVSNDILIKYSNLKLKIINILIIKISKNITVLGINA